MNILNYLKNKKVIIIIIVIITLVIFAILKSKGSKSEVSKQQDTNVPEIVIYKDLKIGNSTRDEAYIKLGSPILEKEIDGMRIIEFKSNNPNFNNELTFSSEKLSFVKEIISGDDNIKILDLNQKYGKYTNVLYRPSSQNNFNLYIYANKGIAYIGNQRIGDILEIWYFPPTDFNNFKQKYALEYLDSPAEAQ